MMAGSALMGSVEMEAADGKKELLSSVNDVSRT